MSRSDYEKSMELSSAPFCALIMAAMRRADTVNIEKLKAAFPEVWGELKARYDAPAGCLNEQEFKSVMENEF